MKNSFRLPALLALVCLTFAAGPGQAAEKILAVVNEDAITQGDVQRRMILSMANTGLPDTPEVQQKLGPQVLRSLIDETLQMQEATRLKITVSDEEIAGAMAQIAKQNNIEPDQLEAFLDHKGVPVSSMKTQIRANISWAKVAQRRLRPAIQIGENEIDAELERLKANVGKTEYLVSEILLPVDNPDQEEEVQLLADRLVKQISQGASFPAMARQFSQSSGAASGGSMGWIQPGQLSEELDRFLVSGQKGMISKPIRDAGGYHILAIVDQRVVLGADPSQTTLKLRQLFLPFSLVDGAGDKTGAMKKKVEDLTAILKSCDDMLAQAPNYPHPLSGDPGEVRLDQLPPVMAQALSGLEPGKPSPPLVNKEGALIMMICEKNAPEVALPSREQISYDLSGKRMAMLQRRLLRDLRQAAFIDIRA
ncbi:MAG: peptidylprolyl isomerase [Pseudomonadota bacterium]|nr:peptidylprolyl isomerase [Pseudomonadota bacterium]